MAFRIAELVKKMQEQLSTNRSVSLAVALPTIVATIMFLAVGTGDSEKLGAFLAQALTFIAEICGPWFLLSGLVIIAVVAYVCYSRIGDIRFGGPEAKPIYSVGTWFVLALNGCIGTGILFWAMGEPIFHFAQPPAGAQVEPFSREAAIFAVSQTMIHWTIAQYAMYTVAGLVIGICAYNQRRKLSLVSYLEGRVSHRSYVFWRTVINAICLCCVLGAVSCSTGVGLMQIASGLEHIGWIQSSKAVWIMVDTLLMIVFITSCVLGIKKGLSHISRICTSIFTLLLVWVLLFGPTGFILNLGVESIGMFINHFVEHSVILPTMTDGETWSRDWTIQFWASFFVYAPILGLFLARLARGRTVRQFIWINIVAPSLFCIAWIAIFASTALYLQTSGQFDIWKHVQESGFESTIFTIIRGMPGGSVLIVVFIVAVFFSLATLCDAITSTMAILSTKALTVADEPPASLKIFWGSIVGAVSFVLISSGGMHSVRSLFAIIGVPTAAVVLWYTYLVVFRHNELFCSSRQD